MRQQHVVSRGERGTLVGAPGACYAQSVAEPRDHPRLVLRDPVADAIAEPRRDDLRVLGEGLDRVAHGPAAPILQGLRQIPVIEGHVRVDSTREQLVDDAVVVVEAGLVHASGPVGEDSRPRDRETERVEAELAHQARVLAVAVVRVARDDAAAPVHDVPRAGAVPIPDALPAAVLARGALDLVRGGRRAPDEAFGEEIGCSGRWMLHD